MIGIPVRVQNFNNILSLGNIAHFYCNKYFLQTEKSMPIAVNVLSGPIGSGKTSTLKTIEAIKCDIKSGKWMIITENIEDWQFYLKKFYENPGEYVFMFQKEVDCFFHRTTRMLEKMNESKEKVTVYLERSPTDVSEIFLELNKDKMDAEEYQCLKYSMERYLERPIWACANYVMLESSPDVCKERIATRDRSGEDKIDMSYVKRVDKLYKDVAKKWGWKKVKNTKSSNLLSVAKQCLTLFSTDE
jgi:deoxyadenosine/deoxycytidine kinase